MRGLIWEPDRGRAGGLVEALPHLQQSPGHCVAATTQNKTQAENLGRLGDRSAGKAHEVGRKGGV